MTTFPVDEALDAARKVLQANQLGLSPGASQRLRDWLLERVAAGDDPSALQKRINSLVDAIIWIAGTRREVRTGDVNAALDKNQRRSRTIEKKFGAPKGFGFVEPHEGSKDSFVHHSATIKEAVEILLEKPIVVQAEQIEIARRQHQESLQQSVKRPKRSMKTMDAPSAGAEPPSAPAPAHSPAAASPPPPAPSPPPAAPAQLTPPREPPRTAYALLDAPSTVVAEQSLSVDVGLSETRSSGVVGEALQLPTTTVYPYVLTIQLVADGFESVDGSPLRRELTATEDAPYPRTTFELRAVAQTEPVCPRALQVVYAIGGQTIGFAFRPIAVLRTAAETAPAAATSEPTAGVVMRVPTGEPKPDLTIHVLRDPSVRERLLWTIESPHVEVRTAADAAASASSASSDIGTDTQQFAKQLVQQVNAQEGKKGLKLQMTGIAKQVAAQIPPSVWAAIRAAANAAAGPPSILILSAEPHIPWELAHFSGTLPVPDAPRFLGAQANVGRWILGQQTPTLPPPHELGISAMAVVWGKYTGSKWGRLQAAEEEAAALHATYDASFVDATIDGVVACLGGVPSAQALHFAIHGVYNPGGVQDGLVLTDGETVNPSQVAGADIPQRPLVFLNACQVGSAQEVLGDYAGIASAFLNANASAVIAPLWSIKDGIAKELSLSFYGEAFAGEPIASVLRKQRAKYGQDNSATYLAYQFFGHPQLRISRS